MSDQHEAVVACPTCNGPLSGEVKEWVCKVGHRFTFPELANDQAEAVVRTLWYALRAVEDRAISSKYAAASLADEGRDAEADRQRARRVEDLAMVDQLYELLQSVDASGRRPEDTAAVTNGDSADEGSHN
jgi:hypothetical protein